MNLFWDMVFLFSYCVGAKMLHHILEVSKLMAGMFRWDRLTQQEERAWPYISIFMALLWPLFGFWLIVMEEQDEQKKEEDQA